MAPTDKKDQDHGSDAKLAQAIEAAFCLEAGREE